MNQQTEQNLDKASATQSQVEQLACEVIENSPYTHKTYHYNSRTLNEAVYTLEANAHHGASIVAGGIDVMRRQRIGYLPELPRALVNIKTIQGLDYVREESGLVGIGALTRVSEIAGSILIQDKYPVLARAAAVVGTPQIRNMATLGGSICQDTCCWYHMADDNAFNCLRKGGQGCPAMDGANQWMHSIMGSKDSGGCYATCQSDLAVALAALNANVRTTQRIIPIREFYAARFPKGNVLEDGEIITEVTIPEHDDQVKSVYMKYALRKSIDHPLVSVACVSSEGGIDVAIGGVAMAPYVVEGTDQLLGDRVMTDDRARAVGAMAVANAVPVSENGWKVAVTRAYVRRALLSLT